MTPLRVELTASAARDLDGLPASTRALVVADIQRLASAPVGAPPRIKRLRGFGLPVYRMRSGDHRVIYTIEAPLVTVLRVIDRKNLERALRRLRPSAR